MTLQKWRVLVVGLSLVGACGGDDPSPADGSQEPSAVDAGKADASKPAKSNADAGKPGTPDDNTDDPPGNTDQPGSGGGGDDAGTPVGPIIGDDSGIPVSTAKCDYTKQTVALSKDLVVPAGKTVHVCEGTTFNVTGADTKIDVLGELIVDGSDAAPVTFVGGTTPRTWHGIVVEEGGSIKMQHAKVGGATYGLYVNAGSSFAIDRVSIDTSFKAAVIFADGTISNCKFGAYLPESIAVTNEVTVDDPNGTVTIIDSSPTVTNSSFDGASGFTDMVRVGGHSSPTFDHCYFHNAHCGFHTNGVANTSIHVSNSIFESLAYGIMAYNTKPFIENSVFKSNTNDVGECDGATNDNTPVLMNNNYAKGSPTIDASCFRIGTAEPSPASTPNPTAGPSGL